MSTKNSKAAEQDITRVLEQRDANGADFWATEDGRVGVGEPFSAISALLLLYELGLDASHEAVAGGLEALLKNWREDGRIRVGPKGAIYPCHTANIARVLCRFGLTEDERLQTTLGQLLEDRHDDGGWRCKRVPMGKSAITDASNPGVTLFALDALRFDPKNLDSPELKPAIDTLLAHWDSKVPTGPCQFGIGTLFKQTEYPFLRYNLFFYVYVLSFYAHAQSDKRFEEAARLLASKLDEDGQLIIERPHRGLADFELCKKGQPSHWATLRFAEIRENLAG